VFVGKSFWTLIVSIDVAGLRAPYDVVGRHCSLITKHSTWIFFSVMTSKGRVSRLMIFRKRSVVSNQF
jgi:hypothetical protein